MSARREMPGLGVRARIGDALPAMFHEDDLAQRWCDGLDEVMAPVPGTLDSLWAYLDPQLAPLDFVEWLANWVGLELDLTWDERRRRDLVARAHHLFDYRGTARGLAELIELYTGAEVEISDGGGASWSASPGAPLPGDGAASMIVRLRVEDPGTIDTARLENMVETSKPAHVVHRIEVERRGRRATPPPPPPPPPPAAPPAGDAEPADGDAGEQNGEQSE